MKAYVDKSESRTAIYIGEGNETSSKVVFTKGFTDDEDGWSDIYTKVRLFVNGVQQDVIVGSGWFEKAAEEAITSIDRTIVELLALQEAIEAIKDIRNNLPAHYSFDVGVKDEGQI